MMGADNEIMDAVVKGLSAEDANPRFIEELQERVDIIRHKLKFIEKRPTVICISSLSPFTVANDKVPSLINVAGGVPAFGDLSQTDWDEIRLTDPEIFVLMLQYQTVEQAVRSIDHLLEYPGFTELSAVKNNRFHIADGAKYFYQDGPAIVDSLEVLAEIINPKQFIFGYEGEGWVKFEV